LVGVGGHNRAGFPRSSHFPQQLQHQSTYCSRNFKSLR
jgi:hypothetical protein